MRDDVNASMEQVEALARVARALADSGLIVYRCRYDFLACGSWMVQAGTSHHRLQIVQDGQHQTIRYATARLQNAGAVPDWAEVGEEPLPDVGSPPFDLDRWIEKVIREYRALKTNQPLPSANR